MLSDHLTQSLEDPSLLSDHLYLPLFFLCLPFFFVSKTHTSRRIHTYQNHYRGWPGVGVGRGAGGQGSSGGGGKKTKNKIYFTPVAEGQLAVSFSGNKVINKVMVPF